MSHLNASLKNKGIEITPQLATVPQIAPKVGASRQPAKTNVQILSGLDWLPKVMEVHHAVRAEMPEAKRHCLMPKTESYFKGLLSGKTGVLFGVVVDGKIVGFMNALKTAGFSSAQTAGVLTCPDTEGRVAAVFGHGKAAVAQSLCVLKAFGGRGYSHALIKAFIDWGKEEGFANLFAQVAQENAPSWMRFLSYDFALVDGWTKGHARFLLRWMSAAEIDTVRGRATTSDLHSVNKDYAEVPALLILIGAMLRQGRIVLAHGAEAASSKLNVIFGRVGPV